MQPQFFGNPDHPLFGVYHPPRGGRVRSNSAPSQRAVLICPPVGQEYNRTHWTLRLLARHLARKGVHVMRMDYQGTGDSAGFIKEIDGLTTWRENVATGIDQLKFMANVPSVMVVGLRLGGTLAANVATRRADVNSVVLWEPVLDGTTYLNQLRQMHARMLDLWVCRMKTPNDDQHEEILGSLYQRSFLQELEALRLNLGQIIQPQLIIEQVTQSRELGAVEPSLQKVILDDRPGTWGELRELETAYLRPLMLQQIVGLMEHMFTRLEHFDALQPSAPIPTGATA